MAINAGPIQMPTQQQCRHQNEQPGQNDAHELTSMSWPMRNGCIVARLAAQQSRAKRAIDLQR